MPSARQKERRDEPNAISVEEIALKLRAKDALEHRRSIGAMIPAHAIGAEQDHELMPRSLSEY